LSQQLILEFVEYINATKHRAMYDQDVNKCINMELKDKFNLSAFSSIEYCLNEQTGLPIGEISMNVNA
jgi:hypothetical protein